LNTIAVTRVDLITLFVSMMIDLKVVVRTVRSFTLVMAMFYLDQKKKSIVMKAKLDEMFYPNNKVQFGIGDIIRKTEWDNPTQWFKIVETHDPEYVVGWFYFDGKRDGPPRGL